jgi:hypothetical protein
MNKLKELMNEVEISEWEASKIEESRQKIEERKRQSHQKTLERKRICSVEEKIPIPKLESLVKDFKKALVHRIDNDIVKVNSQRATGLKKEEKDQLKKIVFNVSSKDLNNPYKRQNFARNIIRSMVSAIMMRENWEFGDTYGPRDLKILDAKFPSLIGVSRKEYLEWVNGILKGEGREPIQIKERKKIPRRDSHDKM